MKVIFFMEGLGGIGVIPYNYVFFDKIEIEKDGKKHFTHKRYFTSLEGVLEELREIHLAKGLMKGNPAKDLKELISKVDKVNSDWLKFYGIHHLDRLGKHLLS